MTSRIRKRTINLDTLRETVRRRLICVIFINHQEFQTHCLVPREARSAEGPPSVARFINLSRGVRARIAKGGQISIGPYIFRWCPHSCLATKPNRDRCELCTLMFLRRVSSFLACFAAFIWVLICLFVVCEQASNA